MGLDKKVRRNVYFDVFGPFELSPESAKSGKLPIDFWRIVNESAKKYLFNSDDELSSASGCYLFAMKRGKAIFPWYVGMTISENGFRSEIFQYHKLVRYTAVVDKCAQGWMPCIFLFPLILTNRYKFGAGKSKKAVITWLERMLIGFAYWRNPNLENKKDIALLRDVTVRGLLGKSPVGRTRSDVRDAVLCLFGDD